MTLFMVTVLQKYTYLQTYQNIYTKNRTLCMSIISQLEKNNNNNNTGAGCHFFLQICALQRLKLVHVKQYWDWSSIYSLQKNLLLSLVILSVNSSNAKHYATNTKMKELQQVHRFIRESRIMENDHIKSTLTRTITGVVKLYPCLKGRIDKSWPVGEQVPETKAQKMQDASSLPGRKDGESYVGSRWEDRLHCCLSQDVAPFSTGSRFQ